MKKINIFVIILCIALLFSGCKNFRMATSIEDLISPVSPSGDNAGIQSAVDEYCKSGYSIKIPASGNYTTSFILYDLDGDNVDEAVAFYEPSNESGTVCMAVLKKNAEKWSVLESIKGEATDVNSVDFSDLNGDGNEEIIVCWSVVSKMTGFSLNVYSQSTDENGTFKIKKISDSLSASDFVCVDINNDSLNELLVFTDGISSDYPKAELYSYKDNKKNLLGFTKLDSSITSFESIKCGETDDGVSVYVDALKSDGLSMVTEFIYWSDYYSSIVSPFYSYSTGNTTSTSRNDKIVCRDLDNDDVIEIPLDASLSKLPSEVNAQDWVVYENTVLKHKCYSLSCKRDGLIIVIPDKYFNKISVKYDTDLRRLTVASKDGKEKIFEIITAIKSNYDSKDETYSGYSEIFSDSGFIYLAKINDKSEIKISEQELKNMINPY